MFYVSLMVAIIQKSRVDSQMMKKGETEHTTMENHQFTKVGRNRGKKKHYKYKRIKMASVSSYLPIITLNIN